MTGGSDDRSAGGSAADAVPGRRVPERTVRDETVPDETVPDETVPADVVPDDAGRLLLPLARRAIAEHLRLEAGATAGVEAESPVSGGQRGDVGVPRARVLDEHPDWLAVPGASFVTLRIGVDLRGCIGTLEAFRPLAEDVRGNAVNAAFRDPRFAPLTAEEFDRIRIEVSVLSAPEPLDDVRSEAEAVARLRPGVDGVILRSGGHRATFLPQVWEQLPSPYDFLARLRRKAGLRPGWDGHTRISRYTVRAWEEE